ncbi:conserved hypothetical protein [Beutenbergia cavernae DSM 12333]|uniref:SURF1-like protein n=1 Tax=Beutenbergia cavernae (strain ATCC BAA-8 / DSM 12333 / CCUG 43141 / JCM 11478 / NBRC 16432 / NCIMB 13614 / HKI 0122) TaxID=471853 RepID=C5BVX5_BEUC1|nr:SURF1 family protein [Beutenbergia cavernae]ACQ80576.1 conserved hypothetical protein [Beutenbergia cavernae DSM 12333]
MSATAPDRTASRTLGMALLVVCVSVACVALGYWQWTRHQDRAAAVAVVERNYDADPVALADVVPPGSLERDGEQLDAADAWTPVSVRGEFVPGSDVLLRNRPVDGVAAMHGLALFRTDDAAPRLLLVDRGWVPAGEEDSDRALEALALPDGPVELVVRLRPAEPDADRPAPEGYVYTATPALVADVTGILAGSDSDGATEAAFDTTLIQGTYGALASQEPAPEHALGRLAAADTDLGSHLSYAFQWWVFALGAPVAALVLARRNRTLAAEDADGRSAVAPDPRRRRTLEEEEDALLDAQERSSRR